MLMTTTMVVDRYLPPFGGSVDRFPLSLPFPTRFAFVRGGFLLSKGENGKEIPLSFFSLSRGEETKRRPLTTHARLSSSFPLLYSSQPIFTFEH